MEERKSMGGALVDVFDAAMTLVKSEISAVARKAGQIAKAKGIGAVLLLAATGPLILGLIFIILAVFYGLMRLGLGAWAAALIIALLSFAVTGLLVMLGLKKLSAEVDMNEPRRRRDSLDQDTAPASPTGSPAPGTTGAATTVPAAGATHDPARTPVTGSKADIDAFNPAGPRVELGRDAQTHAAGETRVVSERPGVATVRIEHGTTTVPVYESKPGGEPAHHSSGLNKELTGHEQDHGHHHDPNLREPVVLKDAPGIPVSTTPTYKDDYKKGES
ncbi:phage holin family protein [Deinococcus taeanensis]|uniref:phage holin family protein n=1 Tax=Deinococcus taeanensis TaxID=2737050 RepID=UPI001CDBBE17|nr:phage holin family protein [Deinococcus taeanensis]UBV41607.1 phage holin family protein [Deinococcus taeanensis]